MFLGRTGRLLHSALGASVCFLVALLLLTRRCEGQYQMVGPSQPVRAILGTDVVLPCRLGPGADVTDGTMEWARSDLSPRFVHVRRDGVELVANQHPLYSGRTHLSSSRLKQGDLSLQLSGVQLSDEGTYRCDVPGKASAEVHLHVGAVPLNVSVSAETEESAGRLLLGCRSAGWYPEPELQWLDGQGTPVSAGAPRTLRGPDGLYAISGGAAVERRAGGGFSCRVQQRNFSQSRTAEFSLKAEDSKDRSGAAARVAVVLVLAVGLVILSSGLSGRWRLKPCKRRDDKATTEEEEGGGEEEERLIGTKDLNKMKRQKNKEFKENQEKERDLAAVLEKLKELEKMEEEMEWSRKQQTAEIDKVEVVIRESKKELEKPRGLTGMMNQNRKDAISETVKELERKKQDLVEDLQFLKPKADEIKKIIDMVRRQKDEAGAEMKKTEAVLVELDQQKEDRKQRSSQMEDGPPESCQSQAHMEANANANI